MKKNIKKTALFLALIALIACLLLPTLTACNNAGPGAADRLVIYNWEDYIDLSIKEEFEDYYKEVTGRSLSITYTTYDTNETMMTKVLKNDANVDLICPSEYAIQKLMLAGCLENQRDIYEQIKPQLESYGITLNGMSSINPDGYGNVEPDVIDAVKGIFTGLDDGNGNVYNMTDYMVPYFYGTLGILYNTKIVSPEELEKYGWGVLWNVQNNRKLENKILMKDSVRDSYAAAIFYMYENTVNHRGMHELPDGVSPTYNKPFAELSVQELINCTDDAMLTAAELVLTEQRDHISGYEVDFGKDDMVNEIVYADLAWSGDALFAIEEGDYDKDTDTYQLDYYVPPTASNIWYDGWVIPKTVNNKLAAMMFIEYMCDPMSGIRNSMEVGYTSAVAKEKLQSDADVCKFIVDSYTFDEKGKPYEVDEETGDIIYYDYHDYFEDTRRYPEIDDTLGVMRDFGTKNETVVQMWQRAKSGAGIEHSLWWILLIIVLGVGLAVGAYFALQALKLRPRKVKHEKDKE